MTLSEKRHDAASTLVVPYDATPDMVDAAYVRRLSQRFGLQNADLKSLTRGNEALYDARVRMRLPEKLQWCAALRLLATTSVDKALNIMKVYFKQLRNQAKSEPCQTLADGLISDQKKLCRKYNVFRAICGYEIGGIWGIIIYNRISQEPDWIIPAVIGGSLVVGVVTLGYLMDSMRNKTIDIGVGLGLLQTLLPYEKDFQK
ncbi:MAG: hypothetical protein K2M34_02265 [Alphaproteobacteria bacterium]|nr:hypothetical protein [Alphaproteobacteria bacterium]